MLSALSFNLTNLPISVHQWYMHYVHLISSADVIFTIQVLVENSNANINKSK